MADTSATRFVGPTNLAGASTSLVTVPAGRRWLVRDVRLVNLHATAAGKATLGIGGVGSGQAVYYSGSIAAGAMEASSVWFVLNAGESLYGIRQVGAGPLVLTVDGYDLSDT
jgi:hypothetical protein